jgi:hypothetical protein
LERGPNKLNLMIKLLR